MPAQRLGVDLRQLLLVGFEPFEVPPPAGLGLAPVVVDQLRHQPAGVLNVVASRAVVGYPGE